MIKQLDDSSSMVNNSLIDNLDPDADMGMQYLQFGYSHNTKMQEEINEMTDQILEIDADFLKQRDKWEAMIEELQS